MAEGSLYQSERAQPQTIEDTRYWVQTEFDKISDAVEETFTEASATPTDITVTDESVDTENFLLFVNEATGDLEPKTNANLTFDSTEGRLAASKLFAAETGATTTSTLSVDRTYSSGASALPDFCYLASDETITGTVSSSMGLNVERELRGSGAYGGFAHRTAAIRGAQQYWGSGSIQQFVGNEFYLFHLNGGGTMDTMEGVRNTLLSLGSPTVTNGTYGVRTQAGSFGGNIGSLTGYSVEGYPSTTGTCTHFKGLHLQNVFNGSSSNYGLYIESATRDNWIEGLLHVGKQFTTDSGRIKNVQRYTSGPQNVLIDHHVFFGKTDSASWTANLPAGTQGETHKIVNTGTSGNTLTVSPNGSENLIGANLGFALADGESMVITYDATDGWY